MDRKEIRSFIDETIYDFETIGCLQEFRRDKETLLFVDIVCRRIEAFRLRSNEGPFDLKGVFTQDFWGRSVSSGCKASDMREKIADLSKDWSHVSADDLRKLGYNEFISSLESWVLKNVSMINKRIKSDSRKKVERVAIWSAGFLVGVGILVFGIFKLIDSTLCRDWGLKGDFYNGENFQKLLSSGAAKTINFTMPELMNGKAPRDHFSSRWHGNLMVPADGEYTFFVNVDDGVRLFIDGQVLMDEWKVGVFNYSKKIFLKKGARKIVLEYFQNAGPASLKLSWDKAKGQKEIISAKYLRHSLK